MTGPTGDPIAIGAVLAAAALGWWGWRPPRVRVGFGPWPSTAGHRLAAVGPRRLLFGLGVVAAAGVAPVATATIVGAVLALRRFRARAARRREHERAVAALPLSLELCQVVLGAGGTITDCLRTLAANGPEPVRAVAADSLDVARSGSRLDVALGAFRDRLGLSFQPLTGTLLLGWRQGGSVGLLLARLTTEANASRRRLGELRARRLPVLLLLPLVAFTLPAVVIGTVVPVVVVAVRDLDL